MRVIRIGSRGDTVKSLQILLKQKDYDIGPVDGIFGSGTEDAVEDFQEKNNLLADGVVGKGTWAALLGQGNSAKTVEFCCVGKKLQFKNGNPL